jgi:hypothetical protein
MLLAQLPAVAHAFMTHLYQPWLQVTVNDDIKAVQLKAMFVVDDDLGQDQ